MVVPVPPRVQLHADAVLALLRAGSGLTVYPKATGGPTNVPNGAVPPYVSVHVAATRPTDGRMPMHSTRMYVRIYCHCTGTNDIGARAVSDHVARLILGVRPVVAGRVSYPIRHETEQPPRPDESTDQLVTTLTEVYGWQTDPGTP